jgi:LysM repeat protein
VRRSLIGIVIASSLLALAGAPPASARVRHVVVRGETLWSIAAGNNLTTRALAAANGVSPTADVVLGSTIWIPTVGEAATALADGGTPAGIASGQSSGGAAAPQPMGGYIVRVGDTLTSVAARSGISVTQLAWMNGLDQHRPLLAGTPLKLPTGAAATRSSATRPAPARVPGAAPHPTSEFVSPSVIGQLAAAQGVPASLATAIARQESGFNNAMVSDANARGVMQVLPGTWDFVQRNLAGGALNPSSAYDNVKAGVMYLGELLHDTGGDEAAATAAYYQGLGSVRRGGALPETRRYVADVMAQRRLYGAP